MTSTLFKFHYIIKLIILFFFSFPFSSFSSTSSTLTARIWPSATFPELPYLKTRPNSGISFSGGGLRSYFTCLGYLSAFEDLNLTQRIKYISAVSGGSWALTPFLFHEYDGKFDAEKFLGSFGRMRAEEISIGRLQFVEKNSAAEAPANLDVILEAVFEYLYDKRSIKDVWYETVSAVFLTPVGVKANKIFAFNREIMEGAIKNNRGILKEDDFIVLNENVSKTKPFPIVYSAILGPSEAAPFGLFHSQFVGLEATPFYVGVSNRLNLSFPPTNVTISYGGFVESFGFGSVPVDEYKLKDAYEGDETIKIRKPDNFFTLANSTATSSWAPGSLLTTESLVNKLLNKYVGLEETYFAPDVTLDSDAVKFTKFRGRIRTKLPKEDMAREVSQVLLADGGAFDNQALFTLIRRGVKKIIVFINTSTKLQPRQYYNPFTQLPTAELVDETFQSYFGFVDFIPRPGFDFRHNKVFDKREFQWIIDRLQKQQQIGRGTITISKLKTLENKWYGVKKGIEVDILWVYLDKCQEWVDQLQPEVRGLIEEPIVNGGDVETFATTRSLTARKTTAKYPDFPFIGTQVLNYSNELANLLRNMAGWLVLQNADTFIQFLTF